VWKLLVKFVNTEISTFEKSNYKKMQPDTNIVCLSTITHLSIFEILTITFFVSLLSSKAHFLKSEMFEKLGKSETFRFPTTPYYISKIWGRIDINSTRIKSTHYNLLMC
jgi:hypothetical protein